MFIIVISSCWINDFIKNNSSFSFITFYLKYIISDYYRHPNFLSYSLDGICFPYFEYIFDFGGKSSSYILKSCFLLMLWISVIHYCVSSIYILVINHHKGPNCSIWCFYDVSFLVLNFSNTAFLFIDFFFPNRTFLFVLFSGLYGFCS